MADLIDDDSDDVPIPPTQLALIFQNSEYIECKSPRSAPNHDEMILTFHSGRQQLCQEQTEVDWTPSGIVLETKVCPRCDKSIVEVDFESHWVSHSTEILPFLYLGGERNANNEKELKVRTSITHILNAAWEVGNFFPDDFCYKNINIADDAEVLIDEYFKESIEFIEKARISGGRVLVHCVQGISRSATIVIAYLMAYKNLSRDTAFQYVKDRRQVVCPNPGFMNSLLLFEKTLTTEVKTQPKSFEKI